LIEDCIKEGITKEKISLMIEKRDIVDWSVETALRIIKKEESATTATLPEN
jgi:hypothetical protein